MAGSDVRASKSTEALRAVLAWQRFWGKKLPKGYVVHHRNGRPTDNSEENLLAVTIAKHNSIHKKGKSLKQQEHASKNKPNIAGSEKPQRRYRK